MTDKVLQIHIELDGVLPFIWRRVQIPESATFRDLHLVIQGSMGWENDHCHMFTIKKTKKRSMFQCGNPVAGMDVRPDWEVPVNTVFTRKGNKAYYEYDFGDCWAHTLSFEGVQPAQPDVTYPRCTDGERACPPEDCGGPWGYEDLLELADKNHDEHEKWVEWCGDDADPNHFDPKEVSLTVVGEEVGRTQ